MRKIYSIAALLLIIAAGCKKFEDFQTDPNKPTKAGPDLLLNTVIQKAFQSTNLGAALANRQMVFINAASNEQYYGWNRAEFTTYGNLRQVIKMEEEANRVEKPEYIPLVKFFKAYYFMQLTNTFGDIPYTSALKGERDTFNAVYDKQQDIFVAVLNDLDAANALINTTTPAVDGDILYKGKMQQWKRLINTFSLRILMSLSLKENNAALNVKARFAKIVNDPATYPLMTGNADNGQLAFFDVLGTRYPTYNDNDLKTAYYLDGTFIDLLKGLKDPRLFSFAEKAPQSVSLPDNDFAAYSGAKGSDPVDDISRKVLAGEVSRIKKRYTDDPVNEPSIAIGYAELQFILAEAVVRGWINGDAAAYYKKGVQASMLFYNIDQASIDAYLALNTFPATNQLAAIMTQKYIASFMNSDWHFFFEQRRTGLPVFDVSGAGVLNNKKVPKRWMYPVTELQTNQTNVNAAINSQFAGDDNINGVMWLLKAE
ncbi:SusD/RagB family nutrient-binding outer membrane lipoprotein [Chitinophaga ginsengisoli]|uniref:SusD-like starch-binding protein associating with outer membrane n=1 Tax=Chitinophaga ginsengisoli TaxID=363837 RepID=A0A2P8FUP4_9BACT|nr:SusD/RagB family nutrient-binding outer membrane lipoprotein [Chitinophaga ginsengisoli]PSL25446.1 SusD-like starch-binding protein associating with outer membrane [Chitinophaga ginsengisoli]